MPLSEELEIESGPRKPNCAVCDWQASLTQSDQDALLAWLKARKPKAQLYRACQRVEPPLDVAYSTFGNHCRECVKWD